ncbi:MAG: VWA domain-containing protein [Bacteroidales bacterium]|nr:VWA domain-containing protein [Candidatus Liminaster caballi]
MTFANPGYLVLLVLLVPAIAFYVWRLPKSSASLQIPSTAAFAKVPRSWKEYLRHVNFALLLGAFAMAIVVMARPQSSDNWSQSSTEGIDIVLTLDVSYSMQTQDFKPNRLEAAKEVASNFVAGRPNDNIGMVIFGKESYTLCPMTSDHAVLANMIHSVDFDLVDGTMTAIGNGLVTGLNRIRHGEAKSKVVILLTDGSNNAGDVSPNDAASVAQSLGIRVYTIGVGTDKEFEMTTGYDMFGRAIKQTVKPDLDEDLLRNMARSTGGRYFRATTKAKLSDIFEEIDQMEKTKMSVREFSRREEEFLPFAIAAIIMLLLHVLLRHTVLRNLI